MIEQFTLPVTGSDPKRTSKELLEQAINAIIGAIQAEIGAIATGLQPVGVWDPTTGVFPSGAVTGTYYVVSNGGTVDGLTFATGDWLIPVVDEANTTSAGDWIKAPYSQVANAADGRSFGNLTELDAATGLREGQLVNVAGKGLYEIAAGSTFAANGKTVIDLPGSGLQAVLAADQPLADEETFQSDTRPASWFTTGQTIEIAEHPGALFQVVASGGDRQTPAGVQFLVQPKAGVVTPAMLGAAGNGTTDDTDALASTFGVAQRTGAVVDGRGLSYRITSQIGDFVWSGARLRNMRIDGSGAPEGSTLFYGGGAEGASERLTSSVSGGAQTVSVESAAPFAVGMLAWLESDAPWADGPTGRVAELVEITAISGTTITIAESAAYRYEIGDNARLTVIDWVRDVELRGVHLIGDGKPRLDTPPAGYNNNPMTGASLRYVRDARILDCSAEAFGSRAFELEACYSAVVDRLQSQGMADGEGLNYGVAVVKGCHYVTIRDGHGANHRHYVTIGGNSRVNRFITMTGLTASGSHDAEPFDSHRDADVVQILNCSAQGGSPDVSAAILQCASPVVRNLRGQGHFRSILRVQPLTTYTYGAVSIDIDGVSAMNASCSQAVCEIDIHSTVNVEMLRVVGVSNTGRNYAWVRSQKGITVFFRNPISVYNMTIADFSFVRLQERGIQINNFSTGNILGTRIGPGILEKIGQEFDCIFIDANANNGGVINQILFLGCVTALGRYSIRANGVSNAQVTGNSDRGSLNGPLID